MNTPARRKLQTLALIYIFTSGFIFWGISLTLVTELTPLVDMLFGLSSLSSVIAGIAIWKWKKWGVFLYVASALLLGDVVLLKSTSTILMLSVIAAMCFVIIIYTPSYKKFN